MAGATENRAHVKQARAVVQAGSIEGGVHIHDGAGLAVVPRQLPAPPRWLIGRESEIAALDSALDDCRSEGAAPLLVVDGPAGVGKTALAIQWALRHAGEFSGGQLYANLRGFDGSGPPSSPVSIVQAFLAAMGIEASRIPANLDAASALYRSVLAEQRICVVLDNAIDVEQVLPLLPGNDMGAALVVSRRRLVGLGLHGATFMTLDLLSESVSRSLLARWVGRAGEEDRAAADRIAAYCAGLPLAVMIVGARAAAQPGLDLRSLATQLEDEATRLTGLDAGDNSANVRSAIRSTYRTLDQSSARAFRYVGSIPSDDLTVAAAASLVGESEERTTELLRGLARMNLIKESRPGRYQTHSLIRLFAREVLQNDAELDQAQRRLVDHYLTTAHRADRLLYSNRSATEVSAVADGTVTTSIRDSDEALIWFADERVNLLAAQRAAQALGWHDRVRLLALVLDTYLHRFGHLEDAVDSSRAGAVAADATAPLLLRLLAHRQLGRALTYAGDYAGAVASLDVANGLTEELDDALQTGHTHQDIARLESFADRPESALRHVTTAIAGYRAAGNIVGEAHALNMQGRLYARLGRLAEGEASCSDALALHRAHENRGGEIVTLDNLGFIAELAGRYTDAIESYRDAIALCRQLGNPNFEAQLNNHLAHAERVAERRYADGDD